MEHIHEPLVGLDGINRCRTCGKLLSDTKHLEEEEIVLGKVSSSRMANRLLDEIAIKGGFHAESFEGGFIVYSKDKNGIREEVTAKKKSDRVYIILQKFISKT